MHVAPEALPRLGDEPGLNRFDDPRPRTVDRFLIRYAATSLRGCLLELLAPFRDDSEARERESAVDADDPELVDPPDVADWQHIRDYLGHRKVVTVSATAPSVVSIDDPAVQTALDREPGVRAVLDSRRAREALLGAGAARVHLDNAAVRLSSPAGRDLTQACALALRDRPSPPDAIDYRSRHDDAEDCWAIFDHADVRFGPTDSLSPDVPTHLEALRLVAELWQLPLPPEWRRGLLGPVRTPEGHP